jgi:hypothetical protein
MQYGGLSSLVITALISAGEDPVKEPRLKQAIDAVAKLKMTGVYAASFRIQFLTLVDPARYRAPIQADFNLITRGASPAGLFTYSLEKPATAGDLSCTQYAWIALAQGAKAGAKVPGRGWPTVAQTLVKTQRADGGWGYTTGTAAPTISMTAAGTTILLLGRDQLSGNQKAAAEKAIERGLLWLDQNLDPKANRASTSMNAYTLLAVQRVGFLANRGEFAKIDWYADGCQAIIKRQGANGQIGTVPDTAMHLLFLGRGAPAR